MQLEEACEYARHVSPDRRNWTRHFVYRTTHIRTTWKFRVGFVVLVLAVVWLTSSWWTAAIARSLVCEANGAPSDAILVENFDSDYLTFEHATRLRKAGYASRVLVPAARDPHTLDVKPVERATAEMLARLSRLGDFEFVPIQTVEPISLNAAGDVLRFIQKARIRSVLVVSPLLRSRRSALVYEATLGRAGITVRCEPARSRELASWTESWHGMQNVAEQWLKLQYYRLYVLPFRTPLVDAGT